MAVSGPACPSTAGAGVDAQPASQQSKPELHPAKQTTLGLYVTAREAYEKWRAAPDKVTILDVRTPEEYMFVGHAPMAWNIPVAAQLYRWDAGRKQFPMLPLPDFVERVQQVAKPDDTLLVMCRSGGRSAMAVNLLASAGYRNVYNITDGMEGDEVKDPGSVFHGQRLVNGWKNSGLPWGYEVDPARMIIPSAR
jgi:rhodanese-related sulfurtransferase